MKKVMVLMTGGTIAQKVDASGRMQISRSIDDLVDNIATSAILDKKSFGVRTGANLTFSTALEIGHFIVENADQYDGFVLITGTDSMEELGFFLDCTMRIDAPVILTGAMKPADIIGYDGSANLEQAIQVATSGSARMRGVMLVMNDNIHLARYVRKQDSQLIGAFTSHPGPVGQIRRGCVYFYYENKRNPLYFDVSKLEDIQKNVQSLIFTFGLQLPREILPQCDGLIVAGMGTASISEEWISELARDWTSNIPIVLVSRCWQGTNYDESYYRGSLEKYEEKGFHLSDFAELNIMQARIKLLLELSTE